LAVAEAEGGGRELHRHVSVVLRPVVEALDVVDAPTLLVDVADLLERLAADHARDVVMGDDPLVVPAHAPPRLEEPLFFRYGRVGLDLGGELVV
jgi:hypothetical protein